MVPCLKNNTLQFLMLNRIDPLETTFTEKKNTIVFVKAVLYLHYKDIEDVENESVSRVSRPRSPARQNNAC